MENLLATIEKFIEQNTMHATNFGVACMGDPCFVHDLRKGRKPQDFTETWVPAWIAAYEAGKPLTASERKARRAAFCESTRKKAVNGSVA